MKTLPKLIEYSSICYGIWLRNNFLVGRKNLFQKVISSSKTMTSKSRVRLYVTTNLPLDKLPFVLEQQYGIEAEIIPLLAGRPRIEPDPSVKVGLVYVYFGKYLEGNLQIIQREHKFGIPRTIAMLLDHEGNYEHLERRYNGRLKIVDADKILFQKRSLVGRLAREIKEHIADAEI